MFDKIKLPYGYNELEPYIDQETVEVHYSKHHQKYLDTLNAIVKENEKFFEGKTLGEVLANINNIPEDIRTAVVNNGGGVYNHNLYFSNLSPTPKKSPEGQLLEAINRDFGSVDNLIKEMSEAAISQFGSGYSFLVKDKDGKLYVNKSSNQNTPISNTIIPILAIDVWEHAYYLKYKNLRPDYVSNIWNVIDWAKVEGLYKNGVL